jgi:hypothetical protein
MSQNEPKMLIPDLRKLKPFSFLRPLFNDTEKCYIEGNEK